MILTHPLDFEATIDGYTRYSNLPDAGQRDRLDTLAYYIAGSQRGPYRVYWVDFVGHADSDRTRGPDFEREISRQRAGEAHAQLWILIEKRASDFGPRVALSASFIFHTVWGAGSTERKVQNPKNEADRARNRRVVITLLHAPIAVVQDPPWFPTPSPGKPSPKPPIPSPPPPTPPWWTLPDPGSSPSSNPFDFKLPNLTVGDWQFKPDFDPIWKTLEELRRRLKL